MQTQSSVPLRILTFNLRTGTCERGTPDAWKERRGDCIALMLAVPVHYLLKLERRRERD